MLLAAVIAGAFFFFGQPTEQTEYRAKPIGQERIVRPDLGISFAYPGGETGLSLIEPPTIPDQELLQAFILFPTADYIEFQQAEEGREAPAGITLFVYTAPETENSELSRMERLAAWATERANVTSFTSPAGEVETVEIDGLDTLHYQADGLYRQDIYLASYQGRIFMFVGQHHEANDAVHTAFQELMETVSFE